MKALAWQVESSPVAEWPGEGLDVEALLQSGWRPLPFQQFILKVHSRCNLACDYCYVYRSADQSWQDQPVRMSTATVFHTIERIAEHVQAHALGRIEVVLHGGEPLLAGPELFRYLATGLGSALPGDVQVDLYVQTNGTLIDEAMLRVLDEHGIRVGVSLDGNSGANDMSRYYPDGRGSHADIAAGLGLLHSQRYRHLFAGLLCVADPNIDPVATYEHLVSYEPPTIDFLLPHANWSSPPARKSRISPTPYGDWLIAAFDRWYSAPRRETSVRFFDEIIRGVLGRPSRVESIGLSPARHIVVETNGAVERIDSLKSTYPGAASTGLHVSRDPFDTAMLDPHVAARQIGTAALSEICQQCEARDVCGGGFYPHRYRQGSGFRNPSVYCDDLLKLIRYVHSRVRRDLSQHGMLVGE